MFPSLFRKIEDGLRENDAADMRVAGFPDSVVESWRATPIGEPR